MNVRRLAPVALLAIAYALPAAAIAHEDHPVPSFSQPVPLASTFNSGGEDAEWELVASIPTGNPHTDIDFFTRNGETYASVGTLAAGINAGGQTIVKLTQNGKVDPEYVTGIPTASCLSDPSRATGLQHDVEATPKGNPLLNTPNSFARLGDAQLLVDASDQRGRCHDQSNLGITGSPRGGLEIIDVTNPEEPKEIGLTSNTGESHTVNIDPKRPHIAYVVTSDEVLLNADGRRRNEIAGDAEQFDLDGFEVVDLSSCMNFPAGTTLQQKRDRCRPETYRYRYPSTAISLGHTRKNAIYGCHELEVYPDDRLACASGAATILFDMKEAFDDRGTPTDFSDDRPRGTPLPCKSRPSKSPGPLGTKAQVMDCVDPDNNNTNRLSVANWLASGAPSLEGVRHLGTAFHMGRFAGTGDPQANARPAYDSTQDIDFSHEAELTESGRFLFATDERGGGILPPGASCDTADAVKIGNGGIHAYRTDRLAGSTPATAEAAWQAYARTAQGQKAIYRAPIRTGAQATVCTSHVFQIIPGQNRIFMGWYSQGTQVIDFTERADGTLDFKEVGYFIPEGANQWVSHVFKAERNADGSFTYYGATGDFALSGQGRNGIDIYKVTLPPPPAPLRSGAGAAPPNPGATPPSQRIPSAGGSCRPAGGFTSATARPKRAGLSFLFARRNSGPATIEVRRVTDGGRVTGPKSVVRFTGRTSSFTWAGRDARNRTIPDGYYVVRFLTRRNGGGNDVRQLAFRRKGGAFRRSGDFQRLQGCGLVTSFRLEQPVFGGSKRRTLEAVFRLSETGRARIVVKRGKKTVRTIGPQSYQGRRTHRVRIPASVGGPGAYQVVLEVEGNRRKASYSLSARRL